MPAGLEAAIEDLYDAFRGSPPLGMEACPCCRNPDDYRPLHQKPLRSLTPDDLGSYASSAMTTVGSVSDFKYFLPRILELAILAPHSYPGIEISLGKLGYGGWRTWPVREQKAIQRLMVEWVDMLVAQSPPDGLVIDTVVSGMAYGNFDIGSALERIAQSMDAYIAVYEQNEEHLFKKKRPSNAFWRSVDPKVIDQYREWLEVIGGQ